MKKLSVVILTHNKQFQLERNLRRLLEQGTASKTEIIVVNNASVDGSVDYLKSLALDFPIKLIFNETNKGVAGGRNSGFCHATGDYIVYLDDDVFVDLTTILSVSTHFDDHPEAGILAFKIHDERYGPLTDHGEEPLEVANFGGAAYAFRRELLEKVGYLDELCTFGGEELDFSIRAHAAGFSTLYLPELMAWHYSVEIPNQDQVQRRILWVFNFSRILSKNFQLNISLPWIMRYSAANFYHSVRRHGMLQGMNVLISAIKGLYTGLQQRKIVPANTHNYYNNPALRPEFGNVGIMTKLLKSR